jgi:hypothetical protein
MMRAFGKIFLLLLCLSAACSSGGSPVTPPTADLSVPSDLATSPPVDLAGADLAGADLAVKPPDLAMPPPPDLAGVDLAGVKPDLATPPDLATAPDMTMSPPDLAWGGACTPGAYRCGAGNAVEVCNSTGTAWLHVSTCAVACTAGLCTGACSAGSRRCNMKMVEECNTAGTAWSTVETCPGSCSSGVCALTSLDVTTNRNLNGEIVVDGDFTVRSGVTVTATGGALTVRARNITVENMGTITAAPKGNKYGRGNGTSATTTSYSGGGGGNGQRGSDDTSGSSYAGRGGTAIPSDTDAAVQGGGNGAAGLAPGGGPGGLGGGVIRLIASDSITISGFLTANGTAGGNNVSTSYGGGGGGAGGGILLAATGKIAVSGAISASGGAGGRGYYDMGGAGGLGRVRILSGDTRTVTGTITGVRVDDILPPLLITSSTHPDSNLIYNDDFYTLSLSWTSPFAARQGYYHLISATEFQVPTPATGTFINTETVPYSRSAVRSGSNYFHIVSVDALTNVGKVENTFRIQINTTPPTVSSSSHPTSTTWYMNRDVFFQWSFPVADQHVKGAYYVFDNYGSTIPSKTDTLVRLPQKQLLRTGVAPGIWVLHVLSLDQADYLTKAASHFRVQIGDDPGNGALLGQVTDMMGKPIDGATVSVNRDLWTQTTNSTGNYNFPALSAGTYELRTTKAGRMPATQMVTITKGGSTTANVSLP